MLYHTILYYMLFYGTRYHIIYTTLYTVSWQTVLYIYIYIFTVLWYTILHYILFYGTLYFIIYCFMLLYHMWDSFSAAGVPRSSELIVSGPGLLSRWAVEVTEAKMPWSDLLQPQGSVAC